MTNLVKNRRSLPLLEPKTAWVQVERAGVAALGRLVAVQPGAARVMLVLLSAVHTGNSVYASQAELADRAGCSPATVARALKYLTDNQWIEKTKAEFGGVNLYVLNDRLAWHGKRSMIKHTKFSADLLVDGEVQHGEVRLPKSEWARPRRLGNTAEVDHGGEDE